RDAAFPQAVGLVLHKRDEGADDDRCPLECERRELKAKALSRAGGHDDQRVATGQRRRNGFGLAGAKASEAELRVQMGVESRCDHVDFLAVTLAAGPRARSALVIGAELPLRLADDTG